MKRGLILLIILLFLINIYAQETKDELRINVDTKILGKDGIFVNLTEYLGTSLDYYLVNKPQYVKIKINNNFKLVHIIPAEGKTGSEVIIITTNKSKEASINETFSVSKEVEDEFQETINYDLSFSYDPLISKTLLESIKKLKLEKQKIYSTYVNFSRDALFINIDNRTALNLSFAKTGDNLILQNITLDFKSEEQDSENLFYERKGFNFIYFLKTNLIKMLIFILGFILIALIITILSTRKKNEITKEEFKKVYVNKTTLLKRICHEENKENVFMQFSNDMREFLAKMLSIKYQFTYDELINELIVKKVDESIKKDLIKFAKAMLEAKYRKKTKLKDIKELIENGISIMERF